MRACVTKHFRAHTHTTNTRAAFRCCWRLCSTGAICMCKTTWNTKHRAPHRQMLNGKINATKQGRERGYTSISRTFCAAHSSISSSQNRIRRGGAGVGVDERETPIAPLPRNVWMITRRTCLHDVPFDFMHAWLAGDSSENILRRRMNATF